MKMNILKPDLLAKIAQDEPLMIEIAKANLMPAGGCRKLSTIKRWVSENRQELTTITNLEVIKKYYGLPKSEVLTIEDDVLC